MMYSEVARVIASEIKIGLTQEEETRFSNARQVNPKSYENYLIGLSHLNRLSPEETNIALQYFELALEIDPNNALALVGISSAWAMRHLLGMVPRQEAMPHIMTPLEKALELDNTLAEAHSALAFYRGWAERDWEGAEKGFKEALRLNPNLSDAHSRYSQLLCFTGRPEEALTHMELAIELDPLSPIHYRFYGEILGANRRLDDAIAALRTALEMNPEVAGALMLLAEALGGKGMYDEALDIYRKMFAGNAEYTKALEDGFEEAGYKGAFRALADLMAEHAEQLRKTGKGIQGFAWFLSEIYLEAGDYELAIDWKEKFYEYHNPNTPLIGMPRLNPLHDEALRSSPRFQELLRKMNLPVDEEE
jgi:tetratricopeptide (TPR) repeat protein